MYDCCFWNPKERPEQRDQEGYTQQVYQILSNTNNNIVAILLVLHKLVLLQGVLR